MMLMLWHTHAHAARERATEEHYDFVNPMWNICVLWFEYKIVSNYNVLGFAIQSISTSTSCERRRRW